MEKTQASQAITNFWAHFPQGKKFGELIRIPAEESIALQQEYVAQVVMASEVTIEAIAA